MASTDKSVEYFGLKIPFLAHLGVVPEYAKDGKSRISLEIKPEYENSFGIAHGGVIMTLLDFAMGAAARSTTDIPLGAMTIDMTVSFLRPSIGKIVVEGSILKPGKTINYCEAIVLNEDGEITAKSSGTFMLRKSKTP
ncbi:PaaI family thioesterase [Polynucleobacter sp. MWH-Braz-FAM2G]|uniref:PaaI family thioesterase n=1 Tax=Polynucleobacter sp. MWH-Braz-FAM2G TaxID=1855883 RepID=UPI001BFCFF5A|nr:PaaI family thioesterase [Polynucleobacter sp. MWH-Braz-FAM2G]QWD91602.1 PaaI family thioesterase [Polynucleobacter sp. MWH-Braz-FAM2G]